MKRLLFLFLIFLSLNLKVYSTETFNETSLPNDLKDFLKNKFPGITFKIDNSFLINNETFLPLIPQFTKPVIKTEIVYLIPEKNTPKLFLFSNDWFFVKLLKNKDGSQTIIDLSEIHEKYKEKFLKSKFPSDLVVPKNFTLKKELASLTGELQVQIIDGDKISPNSESARPSARGGPAFGGQDLTGTLYLTSPDTGKIIYLDLSNLSMINQIQTIGAPWEIAFDKANKIIFVTDFAKDQIHLLKIKESQIFKSFELTLMSSPREIQLSDDGSVAYFIENLANDFTAYKTNEGKVFLKTILPPNPVSFTFLKEAELVAITCPSTNSLVFLNTKDFNIVNQIMIDGGPEKIIFDTTHNNLFIANRNGNNIAVVDISTKKIKNTIQVGETPTALALHPMGKWLYVGNGKSNTISIIDTETYQIKDIIPLPNETQFPGDLEVTQDGKYLIVTSETTSKISIIDLATKKVAVKLDVGVTTHAALILED